MSQNGIYMCACIDLSNRSSGISKKINSQINILKNNGYNISTINISNTNKKFFDELKFILPFVISNYEKDIISLNNSNINLDTIDFAYIRKITFCKGFIELLKILHSHNIKILLEIPTYPFGGEYQGLKKILNIPIFFYSIKLKKYVHRIVTYSNDKMIWGIRTINIANSVDFFSIKKKTFLGQRIFI